MRNRRAPSLRATDAARAIKSRFAMDTIKATPATPAVSAQPFGNLARASIDYLAKLAADEVGSQLDSPRGKRRRGTQALLEHLSTCEGRTWQERWHASGLDSGDHPVHELGQDKYHGYNLTHGLKALLCLRAIKVSISGFRGNKFNQYPHASQPAQRDPLLDEFFEATARSRASQKHQYRALFDVCCALTTQGIALADLTPEALLFYADECRRLNLVVGARPDSNRFAGLLAWEVLHGMGHFPPDTPPTLRTYIYKGQRSPEQMVDFYRVRNPEVRQLIIDYIVRREGDTDYVTREGLTRAIAGEFWSKIENIAPEQRTLNLPQEIYDQWREVVRLRKDGQPRADGGTGLLLVSPELGEVLTAIIFRVRAGNAALPLVSAYDVFEQTRSPPMPFLFQRRFGTEDRPITRSYIRECLVATSQAARITAAGQPLEWRPHDFRRIFVTDAIRSGLPPHIAAKVCGHSTVDTTMGYAAIYPEDVIVHHRAFIARRRAERPSEEYRDLTAQEWDEFLAHFELRKVTLGTCGRDHGSPCAHENACVRCPLLRVDPDQMPRLQGIHANLVDRLEEANQQGWLGEVAAIQTTLAAAAQKLEAMRAAGSATVHLGLPDIRASTGRSSAEG
jgi:hypothetical protein